MPAPSIPGITRPGFTRPADPGAPGGLLPPIPAVTSLPGPVIPFFPAGYKSSLSDWHAWWYLNALFFQTRVVFRARQLVTPTTITNDGNPHLIGYDTVDEDPWGGWDAGAFAWTPKLNGWYQATIAPCTAALPSGTMLAPSIAGTYAQRLASTQGPIAETAGAEGRIEVYLIGGASTVQGAAAVLNAASSVNTLIVPGQCSTIEIMYLGS